MAKRINITETNSPSTAAAEVVARLLIQREKDRLALPLVDNAQMEKADGSAPPIEAQS